MPGIPAPTVLDESSAESLLSSARANAQQSLQDATPGNQTFEPVNTSGFRGSATLSTPPANQPSMPMEPPPDAIDASTIMPPTPPPDAVDTSVPFEEPSIGGFLKEEFKGTEKEIGSGIMRGFTALGRAVAMLGGGAVAVGVDQLHSLATGTIKTGAQDAVFDFVKNYVDSAYDDWHAEGETGGAAQVLGHVAEAVPALTLGAAAAPVLAAQSATDAGKASIDEGQDVKTAAILATTAAFTTALGMKLPMSNPSLVKRLAQGALGNVPLTIASQKLTKEILKSRGYREAAAKINPLDPSSLGESGLMGAIFGVMAGKGPKKVGKEPVADLPPTPPPDAVDPTTFAGKGVTNEGAPVTPIDPTAPAGLKPRIATPGESLDATVPGDITVSAGGQSAQSTKPAVADRASAEPLPDLFAQVNDLHDPTTPRQAVYLSADNLATMKPEAKATLVKGLVEVPNFDEKGGSLLVRNDNAAQHALAVRDQAKQLAGPQDGEAGDGGAMQMALGFLTDAGKGKSPDQTAVVQGQTPEGAVASEAMVRPDEVPARVAQMQAEGKTPIVTTPEAAIARREGWSVDAHLGIERRKVQQDVVHERRAAKPAEPVRGKTEPVNRPEPSKPERGIVKTGAGDRAVEIAGPAENGKVPVKLIDKEGNASDQVVHVPESAFVGRTVNEAKPASEPTKAVATKVEAPEPQKPAEVLTPVAPESQVSRASKPSAAPAKEATPQKADVTKVIAEQLGDAMDTLKSQETPPPGKKFPASLKDRAMNVASFARALKAAAQSADVPAEIKARAIAAAKAVERVDLKSDEAIAKNQGVGHSELATHVENLLNAAELLRNPEAKVGEVKAPKAEKLKARIAAKKTAPEAAVKKEPAPKVEKIKVVEDIPDERPEKRVLTKGEQLKLKAAGDRMIKAKDEDLDARRTDIEKLVDEIYQGKMHPDDKTALMHYIEAERRDRLRKKTRDEEIEDEFSDQRVEREAPDSDEDYAKGWDSVEGYEDPQDATASGPQYKALHDKLTSLGFFSHMERLAEKGGAFDGKRVMNYLAAATPEGPLRDFMTKVATHIPDDVKMFPVHEIKTLGQRSSGAAGVFTTKGNIIQIKLNGNASHVTRTIAHEMVHAATVHMVKDQPNHPFSKEIERLRQIAEDRARTRFGHDVVTGHMNYYRTGTNKPAIYSQHLYGLANSKEFMSEVMTNPKFQEFLSGSEKFKGQNEGFIGGVHNLARAVFDAVRKMLGLSHKEGRLLEASMRATENVMEAQKRYLSGESDVIGIHGDEEILRNLDEEPRPLRGEPALRAVAGGRAAFVARQFYRATRARAVAAARRTVLANETHDQIIRSNAHWFGNAEDARNPLRHYDEVQQEKNAITSRVLTRAREAVTERNRITRAEDKKLGQFQIDSTLWGIDPSKTKEAQPASVVAGKKFETRWADFQRRWANLSDSAKKVYVAERDFNQWAANQNRRAAIDAALDSYSERDVTDAQRHVLYAVRSKGEYDSLVGTGKLIDVGERNKSLVEALKELAGLQQREGPYFHLGRHGDYVVQIEPEGSRDFTTQAEAEAFAAHVRDMGPGNKAKVAEVGGKWNVSSKIQYVSMHENSFQAEQEANALRAAGYKVGQVTQKVLSKDNAPLSNGIQQLVAEATRKLERRGAGAETKAMSDSLRQTFVTMTAARSAYAASKLARRGFAGVKGEEMGRNFAAHAQSMAWNTGNLGTVFKSGEALGRIREMAKSPSEDVPQNVVYKRGAVMDEIGKRMQQEVSQYGLGHSAVNAVASKLGFLNFLASPAHAAINMTQNFTTAIPMGVAKYGVRAVGAFGRSMHLVGGPSFRAAVLAHMPGKFTAEDIASAVVKAVGADPALGKWVKGGQLQQLMDRGVISSTFAHEISTLSHKGRPDFTDRVFEIARILPQMAEVYNRVSTALAGLELTGGDVAKTADFVHETHLDYSQGNKSRVFKSFSRVPGGNAVLMFKTYVQGMAHLLYGNVKQMVLAETKSRAEAAKTVAALIVAQSIFAGVVKGALLEPLKLGVYAYNKLFGDDDEYFSLENSVRRAVSSMVGKGRMSDAITGGAPRLAGIDLSSRMGFSDLFFHNPPDLLAADTKQWMQFAGEQLGPMPQMVATQKENFMSAIERGDTFDALMSLVPVKMVQDMNRAFHLATEGKKNMAGGQLTTPSAFDAAVQALGIKPASVARAQERTGTAYDYRQFGNARQKRILDAAAKTGINQSVWTKVNEYNRKNPGNRITVADFIKQQRAAQRGESAAQGGPERDPKVRELLDY